MIMFSSVLLRLVCVCVCVFIPLVFVCRLLEFVETPSGGMTAEEFDGINLEEKTIEYSIPCCIMD